MIVSLTQFADSSAGLGALGIDGKAFVIQLITFGLVFLVLKKWAFEPIIKVMNQRRETIEKGVELGQQMQKEKVELEAKIEAALHKARLDGDKIISDAEATAKETIKQAEDEARTKADNIVAQADVRIKQDAARARASLEKEIVGLVSDATEVIIGEKVDAKKDADLIDKALKGQTA